ncbi:MAG: DNA-processing protein DprA [Kiritimatiellia bacterium]|jgi:DNA processing protein|nr:DNA-processing protein DprA [Kiritimatiellia bacterium]MDP6848323.1 DNA-processing protein DprA [Kiritimatiellia bacterium]
MNERHAYVALNMMEKVGPVGVRALTEVLGSAELIFEADKTDLMKADGIGPDVANAIVSQRDHVDWEGELDKAEKSGARIVTRIDSEYPASLKEIHDPPLALYVRGSFESRDKNSIAVVGTRRPTLYGKETAARLSAQLVKCGFAVVSGMAEGIDTVAHEAALKANGRTLAVMGSGLDCIYPASNKSLAGRISDRGAVVTEFPFGRRPDKTTFPMRNRIVSGMTMGVLVVEAGSRSGAIITVNQALDQGRTVFAVPGRIDSNASKGTNELIRQGARLVTGIDDVLAEFEFLLPEPGLKAAPESAAIEIVLQPKEEILAGCLAEGAKDVDSLIRLSDMGAAEVNATLIALEMKRVVRMMPGRMVELTNRTAIT